MLVLTGDKPCTDPVAVLLSHVILRVSHCAEAGVNRMNRII
jgi:hypothetical protein